MAQAATYSNMSRPTPTPTPTPTPNHSANPSTSTTQSRQSLISSNTPTKSTTPVPTSARNSSIQTLSPIAADLYEGATQATVNNKKTFTESTRRKRPAFLALQPEQVESTVEGRHIHTKRDKDQLRKSSPTVGDQFTFVPGEPPPEGAPPHPKVSFKEVQQGEHVKQASPLPDALPSEPPNGPLPKPPSRSPSRSRSPPKPFSKPASRAPSRAEDSRSPSRVELSKSTYNETSTATPSPEKQESLLDEQLEQSITELEEENRKSQTSSPQEGEPFTPPPSSEVPEIREIPQARKQKSSSSVRSQIMTLPETARLRKQASAELMLRKQPSAELLAIRQADASIPALPIPMNGHVRGNAFGKQGSHTSLQMGMRSAPPRTSSLEGLSENNRKRSATDLASQSSSGVAAVPLPLRPRRSISRSASDAQRPKNLRMRKQSSHDRDLRQTPISTTLLTTSQPPTSTESESWPLTPEIGNHPDHFHPHPRNLQVDRTDYEELAHSRNTSGASFTQSRLLSPEHTPRASRTSTPYSGTPKRRQSNTQLTLASDGAEREPAEDAISVSGSVAPSIMSAQWYRPPRERLGLGTRMSRTEILPWELGGPEEEGPPVPPKPKTPSLKPKKFSMFPGRAPSRMKEGHLPDSPPRSPLLTDKFLVDVKDSLPESPRSRGGASEQPDRPGTSMKSRDGATTPDWSRKKPKKEKKEKKDRAFPSLGELVSEYKGMTNTWYTSAYAEEANAQKLEREAKRPATGTTSLSSSSKMTSSAGRSGSREDTIAQTSSKSQRTGTPRPSRDMGSSMTSSSGSTKDQNKEKNKKKKKSSAFPTMKEMWSEYKNMGNSWYTAAYREEPPRDIASPQSGFS
jgi:hypothetical protein